MVVNFFKLTDYEGDEVGFLLDIENNVYVTARAGKQVVTVIGSDTDARALHKWLGDKIGENDGKRTDL